MYMDYIITLIYLVDWVTWVSNLERENVMDSRSTNNYFYMFTWGLRLNRCHYLITILQVILIPIPSIPLIMCSYSCELSIELYHPGFFTVNELGLFDTRNTIIYCDHILSNLQQHLLKTSLGALWTRGCLCSVRQTWKLSQPNPKSHPTINFITKTFPSTDNLHTIALHQQQTNPHWFPQIPIICFPDVKVQWIIWLTHIRKLTARWMNRCYN